MWIIPWSGASFLLLSGRGTDYGRTFSWSCWPSCAHWQRPRKPFSLEGQRRGEPFGNLESHDTIGRSVWLKLTERPTRYATLRHQERAVGMNFEQNMTKCTDIRNHQFVQEMCMSKLNKLNQASPLCTIYDWLYCKNVANLCLCMKMKHNTSWTKT